MSADGVQSRAVPQFALDIGDERPRLLIGGAAHHHAVDPTEMRKRRLDPANAAVKNDSQAGMRTFEPIDAIVIEWRDFAVVLWRKSLQPGLAGMDDERIGAGLLDTLCKNLERLFGILLVDADPAFDGDGYGHRGLHRRNAFADKSRLGHQAGAEAAVPHPVRRTADVEIDLVKTQIRTDARAGRQRPRFGAAELQRQRMLGRIETQKPRP